VSKKKGDSDATNMAVSKMIGDATVKADIQRQSSTIPSKLMTSNPLQIMAV